jgi:hypothetical protein
MSHAMCVRQLPHAAVLLLTRPDPAHSMAQVVYQGHVKKAARQYQHGMTVVRVGASNASRQWHMPDEEALVAETGLSPSREVVATVKADPSCSYVVIPYNRCAVLAVLCGRAACF